MKYITFTGDYPPDVADALLSILRKSILLIRMAGNGDDADFCAIEANHIHNVPGILRHYDRGKLEYYLASAQSTYTSKFQDRFNRPPTEFMSEWKQLEDFLKNSTVDELENPTTDD